MVSRLLTEGTTNNARIKSNSAFCEDCFYKCSNYCQLCLHKIGHYVILFCHCGFSALRADSITRHRKKKKNPCKVQNRISTVDQEHKWIFYVDPCVYQFFLCWIHLRYKNRYDINFPKTFPHQKLHIMSNFRQQEWSKQHNQ